MSAISCGQKIMNRLDSLDAIHVVDTFLGTVGASPEIRARLELPLVDRFRRAAWIVQLRDLGNDAFHEWGGVLWDFTEFVCEVDDGIALMVLALD
jgi:hypothetical protein